MFYDRPHDGAPLWTQGVHLRSAFPLYHRQCREKNLQADPKITLLPKEIIDPNHLSYDGKIEKVVKEKSEHETLQEHHIDENVPQGTFKPKGLTCSSGQHAKKRNPEESIVLKRTDVGSADIEG